MANGFDPRLFDFKRQTSSKNFQTSLGGLTAEYGHGAPYSSWSDYAHKTGNMPWQMRFDEDDIKLAQQMGASPYAIQQLVTEAGNRSRWLPGGSSAKGLEVSGKVHSWLAQERARNPSAFQAPIDYGAQGGYGFDWDDIKSMWGAGPGSDAEGNPFGAESQEFISAVDRVRDAKIWAQNQNLTVGGGVDSWIQNKENQTRMATEAKWHNELLAQQQAAAEEQAKIQREAAARAARVSGSSPTGVGGAASIKGSRLSITEGKGRKGTKAFSRPTEFLNTLGIGGGGATNRSSTVTL